MVLSIGNVDYEESRFCSLSSSLKNGRVIQSIQRAFDVIECFNSQRTELSLNEISKLLQLNKSTVHSIINTILVNGYISQNAENGKYLLGKKFIPKSMIVSNSLLLKNIADQYLEAFSDKHNVTSHLFVYERSELYCVKRFFPLSSYYIISSIIGRKMPFHATASGKVILAHMKPEKLREYLRENPLTEFTEHTITDINALLGELEKIQCDGYSIEREEVENGVLSIACPIYRDFQQILGTISLSMNLSLQNDLDDLIADLKQAGTDISKEFVNS